MKILFLGFAKIKYMPYINFYLESIKNKGHDIHIVYWNRDLKEEKLPSEKYTYYVFKFFQNDNVNKFKKFFPFLKYRRFVKQILKKQKFDKIVILHTFPGVLTADILKKHYKNKYIFDYRDSTFERFYPFKRLINSIIKNSYATFTSSDGFRKFFFESPKIHTSHNLLLDSLNHREIRLAAPLEHSPLRISFWGFPRDMELNRHLIARLANDERFELHYYGRTQGKLSIQSYCEEKNVKNVFFHGEYTPEQRYDFVANTDILHNLYNDENMMLAASNKLYDGPIFYLPQLCFEGSFMGDIVSKENIGLACNPFEESFAETIIDYYNNIDRESLKSNCDNYINKILTEYHSGLEFLNSFFE